MSAVSPNLISLIKDLQRLNSLQSFNLGGGTNLALRFNHRKSIDIDLFSHEVHGKKGFNEIKKEILSYFKDNVISIEYPCDINDQFLFLRCFIKSGEVIVKVELIQNMKATQPIETLDGIHLYSLADIGIFKLMSVSNRFAKKDVYDLDYITENIPLSDLLEALKEKNNLYNLEIHKSIFDLDDENNPIQNPRFLIEFDNNNRQTQNIPNHSNDTILLIQGKSWNSTRYSWRTKVRELFTKLKIPFPGVEPIN